MAMKKFSFLLALILSSVSRQNVDAHVTLQIGGLFGIDTSAGGWNSKGIVPAVQMAFEDINNNTEILKDYKLELLIKDSKCNIGEAVRGAMEYISTGKPKIMFLGPGCSKAAMPVAESVHYWNIVQIGFSNSSPLLSAKQPYPLYFRTNPSEYFSNLGRVAMLKRFKWKQVAILQKNQDVFTGISNSLADLLTANNISIVTYESFKDHPRVAIENLKKKDARIIFGFFYQTEHYTVFCETYRQGMYGDKYVWILISGRNDDNWWKVQSPNVDCTPKEIREGLGNNLGTGEMKLSTSPHKTIAGQTPAQLWQRYVKRANAFGYTVNSFAPFGYDAAWSCALTLNTSIGILKSRNMTLSNFSYTNVDMRKIFVEILKNTSFSGMTGQIRFDKNFDRITKLEIRQIQGDTERRVGLYDTQNNTYNDDPNTAYVWQGGRVPVDGLTMITEELTVSPSLFWTITVLSLIGILMSWCFLIFNIYKREVRYIKMSSPNLNNLLIVGCIMVYIGGIVSGYYGNQLHIFCKIEVWIITIGFTLAFGALFSKTWRVHVIFFNSNKTSKRVIIRDRQLFGMIGVLLLIDLIILITWQLVDPLVELKYNMRQQITGNTAVLPYIKVCGGRHLEIWKAVMFGYKGLLLLFGTYLAWETRKVHIPALNDSKLIGMSVYNVVVPCVLIIPIKTVLQTNPTASFGLTSFLTIFCTTFTLCIVFIPKILFLRQNDGNDISTVAGNSVGTAIETTRNQNSVGVSTTNTEPGQIEHAM